MKIEHIAINVADPVALAAWYCEHLGLSIARHVPEPVQMHFLKDNDGSMIEIYCNPPNDVPDYASMNPLVFHIAFVSENPDSDIERLVKVGASLISNDQLPDGSQVAMLRDPWGITIQFCKRSTPFD